MSEEPTTAKKILHAGRALFNAKGYAATALSDIASAVGISKGNLTYHFPTKRHLASQLIANTRQAGQDRRSRLRPGEVADDYVEHLLYAMDMAWHNRFIFRDRAEFAEELGSEDSELVADFEELRQLMQRVDDAGLFRKNAIADLTQLTRSAWIVSRYWMDYLREFEGQEEINWADQERGVRQHLAVLFPCLTAAGRKKFEVALDATTSSSHGDMRRLRVGESR